MSWIVLVILAWVAFGLEIGFQGVLSIRDGRVSPSFVVPLIVVVALNAPPRMAAWAALVFGLVLDLTWRLPMQGGGTVAIIGPYAIGSLLAAQMVLSTRGVVIAKNPLTIGVLSLFAAAVIQIVVVGFLTARMSYGDPVVWAPTQELGNRLLSAVYTGIVGLGIGVVLLPITSALGIGARTHSHMR